MNKTNKKGISTIVATVLIVLLTVSAVSVLWGAIVPLVEQSLPGTECFGYQNALNIDSNPKYTNFDRYGTCTTIGGSDILESACSSSGGSFSAYTDAAAKAQINIRIERYANTPNIEEIKIILDNQGSTAATRTITPDDPKFPTEGGIKIVSFDFDGSIENSLSATASLSVLKEDVLGECQVTDLPIKIEKKVA